MSFFKCLEFHVKRIKKEKKIISIEMFERYLERLNTCNILSDI